MITSEELILIKEKYLKEENNYAGNYLCNVAKDLGLKFKFQDYLLDNLEGTWLNIGNPDPKYPRWRGKDTVPRLNWLDKHIELLDTNNN